jgi:two-component system, OmpR family, response regulator
MTKAIRIGSLVICIAMLICIPGAVAIPAPDYTKIVQIQLKPADTGYLVSSLEVRYGKAPNLNLKTGPLTGTIADSRGKPLSSFSVRDPDIVLADSPAPGDGDTLVGYAGTIVPAGLTITVPYLQGMDTFTLADAQSGAVLATADLAGPATLFCADYPVDPDCISRVVPQKQAAPDSATLFILAAIFSVSVLMAAGLAIMTLRRRMSAPLVVPAVTEPKPVKRTVLIVDDDPDMVEIIHQFLTDEGYATIQAMGGKECLAILKKQLPDLILLDVLMQPMSGWETLEQIKNDPITKPIPVLMLTGKRLTSKEAKQYNICIDDYITKPFKHEEIFAAIDNILQRKERLKLNLELAKKAGVDREMFCELAKLSRRISINKKIIHILESPEGTPAWADEVTPENREVIEQISVTTQVNEKRAEQLKKEINSVFRSKGLPELNL